MGKGKGILAAMLAMVTAVMLMPATASAAGIQAGLQPLVVNSTTQTVMFTGKEWYVIGIKDASGTTSGVSYASMPSDSATLLVWQTPGTPPNTDPYGDTAFDGNSNNYGGSELQLKMVAFASGIPAKELALINARTLTATDDTYFQIKGGDVPDQKLWPLSYDEVQTINNIAVLSYGYHFWLRSPYDNPPLSVNHALSSGHAGDRIYSAWVTYAYYLVRPAFNVDLSSVIFTSAAAGGKSAATVGSGLVSATAPTAAIKFTVQDAGLTLTCTDTAARNVKAGDIVNIVYSSATTGTYNYVSCVIEDSGGTVLFYGKLATAASGTASFTVPAAANLPDGSYTIKLFNEECNADTSTDFASTPISIPMTVNNPIIAPTITSANSTTAVSGVGGTFQVTATGDAPIIYSLDGTEPAGVTINGATGLITFAGTTAVGSHTFTITASNGVNPAATQPFTLTVAPDTTPPRPPSVLPQTGDGFPMGALIALMGVSFVGMGWIGFRLDNERRRKQTV